MKIKYIVLNMLFVLLVAVNSSFGQIAYTEPDYTSGKNVVYTIVPRKAVFNLHQLNANDFSYVFENIKVLDGFGKPIQSIKRKTAPDGKNIVSDVDYDAYGRVSKSYLPYAQSGNTTYVSNSITSQATFYNDNTNDVVTDSKAYAESTYENHPLGRLSTQLGVGEDWHTNNKKVSYTYTFNTANQVRKWVYNGTLGYYEGDTYYPAGTLYVSEVTDEQGHTVKQYSDQHGNVVQKEMEGLITWNIYDELDRLVHVVPPEAINAVAANGYDLDMGVSAIESLCYEYVYDDYSRLVKKKLPGMESVVYVYDKLGRPILSQNGEERKNNLWEFVKYDVYGRTILSGVYNDTLDRPALQAVLDASYPPDLYETFGTSGIHTVFNYSNSAFPDITEADVNQVNYYDKYDKAVYGVSNIPGFEAASTTNGYAKGLPTVSKSKVLGTTNWLTSEVYYNEKGRVIQTASTNIKHTIDREYFEYNFAGQLTKSKLFHDNFSNDLNVWKYYEYDHSGRLLSVEQKIEEDNNRTVKLAEMEYNGLGQAKTKKMHETGTNTFLQKVDYTYDIRGSLAAINDPTTQSGENDLFGLQIYKTDITGLGAVTASTRYDGKIAGIKWQVFGNNTGLKSYGYTYDNKGRLSNADHSEIINSITHNNNYNVEDISYDKNGNIKSLKRRGLVSDSGGDTFGYVDNLTYLYDGNQLKKVSDQVTGSIVQGKQFTDGANLTEEYTYDDNGNMIGDKNKGIDKITYNVLNLPDSIYYSDSTTMRYYYTSNGNKLKEVYQIVGGSTTTREYVAGMLYINNVRQYLQTETGRVTTTSGYTYIHNIADHQGNIRVCFQNNGSGTAELVQENHYYPFGLTTRSIVSGTENKHLYSSKEWKDQNGEQWYDFGWRNYDAALGRWFNADPLAEKMSSVSTFSFCLGDPINYIDPKGLYPKRVNSKNSEENKESNNSDNKKDADGYWVDSATGERLTDEQVRNWFAYGSYTGEGEVDEDWVKLFGSKNVHRYEFKNGEVDYDASVNFENFINNLVGLFNKFGSSLYSLSSKHRLFLATTPPTAAIPFFHRPDAVSITPLNVDIVGGPGADFSHFFDFYVLNGNDAGLVLENLKDGGFAIGLDFGVSIILTEYYYIGDINNFRATDILGNRHSLSVGFSVGVELGSGVTFSSPRDNEYLVGVSFIVGVSPPGYSGNVNTGSTN